MIEQAEAEKEKPDSQDAYSNWLIRQIERSSAYNVSKGPLRPNATLLDYLFGIAVYVALMRLMGVDWTPLVLGGTLFFGGHALYVRFWHKS